MMRGLSSQVSGVLAPAGRGRPGGVFLVDSAEVCPPLWVPAYPEVCPPPRESSMAPRSTGLPRGYCGGGIHEAWGHHGTAGRRERRDARRFGGRHTGSDLHPTAVGTGSQGNSYLPRWPGVRTGCRLAGRVGLQDGLAGRLAGRRPTDVRLPYGCRTSPPVQRRGCLRSVGPPRTRGAPGRIRPRTRRTRAAQASTSADQASTGRRARQCSKRYPTPRTVVMRSLPSLARR